ncbi:MAG TPA: TIGR02186 family protein [Geminicoccaceae bacterium]|nr:TIGR02186 family protein [Geminicoccaceae bacterium]
MRARTPRPTAPPVLLLLGGLLLLAPAAGPARAEALIADLSSHLIAITTAFAGTEVLLFGATGGEGDVAVTVTGPETEQVVRRKQRLAGIWLNRDGMTFRDVPAYYAVASSRPLHLIAAPEVLARHQIGVHRLELEPVPGDDHLRGATNAFRQALIRNKQAQGLYGAEPGRVLFIGPRLFRTSLWFPANVPPGSYRVQTFLLQDGNVVSAQTNVLLVSKVGLEADLYDAAQNQAALYGAVAVLISLVSGYLAGLIFRKD